MAKPAGARTHPRAPGASKAPERRAFGLKASLAPAPPRDRWRAQRLHAMPRAAPRLAAAAHAAGPRPRSLTRPVAPRITSPRNPTCRAPALARRTPPALTRRAPHIRTHHASARRHAPRTRAQAPSLRHPPPHISPHRRTPRTRAYLSRSPRSPHRAPLLVPPHRPPRPRALPSRPRAATTCFT